MALLGLWVGRELGLPWFQRLLLLLPLVALELLLRWLVGRHQPRFEQELARLSHGAEPAAVLEFIGGQHLLRFAAPRGYLQGKLAACYRRAGQHRRAAEAFRLALEDAPAAGALPLALGLADSLYELGEARESERVYRIALDGEQAPSRACVRLSQLIRRRGGDLQEAEAYLRRSTAKPPDLRWQCELAQLLLAQGKLEEAEWQLELCVEALGSGGATGELEREVEAVRRALTQARP